MIFKEKLEKNTLNHLQIAIKSNLSFEFLFSRLSIGYVALEFIFTNKILTQIY